MAIRGSMHQVGGALLERLLNGDSMGYQGVHVDCGRGHQAQFVDYRSKEVLTVLATVPVRRAYYHCSHCGQGVIPRDQELDIVRTSFSPGVRRLMGQVGSKEAFDQGRQDLEQLAGIRVKTKEVERVAESLGWQIEAGAERERQAVLSGKVVPLNSASQIPKLYIAMDATGVPVVPRETQGRAGKDGGQAKTRDAKLGCVFTQTGLDEQKRPVRDERSTTYVGAIEMAEPFGRRIYAEAIRRGLRRAGLVIVLGDGAVWIWNIAEEQFPGAIQIVDLYHAREHLANLGKLLYGPATARCRRWTEARKEELDAGNVGAVVGALKRITPQNGTAQQEVCKAVGYFQSNAHRMRYADFRRQGLFVGSGVVEAGCRNVIGLRLKQSGMHWTVPGANAIITLRCTQLSARWEEFWENRAIGQ